MSKFSDNCRMMADRLNTFGWVKYDVGDYSTEAAPVCIRGAYLGAVGLGSVTWRRLQSEFKKRFGQDPVGYNDGNSTKQDVIDALLAIAQDNE